MYLKSTRAELASMCKVTETVLYRKLSRRYYNKFQHLSSNVSKPINKTEQKIRKKKIAKNWQENLQNMPYGFITPHHFPFSCVIARKSKRENQLTIQGKHL